MSDILLHPDIRPIIKQMKTELPHTLLLTGERGIGLMTIASQLKAPRDDIVLIQPRPLTKTSTTLAIGVETIRELYEATRSKRSSRLTVVIDDADAMTLAAQNSFLKLLEEPVENVHFILLSHFPERLLPTVRSRAQAIHIPPLTDKQTEVFIDTLSGVTATKRRQLMFIARGLPAELTKLASDDAYFTAAAERTTLAKNLIEAPAYGRLSQLMKAKLDRTSSLELIEAMLMLLRRHVTPESIKLIDRLLKAYDSIRGGGNVKLQLAHAIT